MARKSKKSTIRRKKNPYRKEGIPFQKPFMQFEIDNIPFMIDNRSGNVYVGDKLEARINIDDPKISWEFFGGDKQKIPYIQRAIDRWNLNRLSSLRISSPPDLD